MQDNEGGSGNRSAFLRPKQARFRPCGGPLAQRLPYDMARSGQARMQPRHMRHFSFGQVGRPFFMTMAFAGQVRSQRPQPTHASLTVKLLQDNTRSSSTWRIRPSVLLAFLHVPIAASLVPPAFSLFTSW